MNYLNSKVLWSIMIVFFFLLIIPVAVSTSRNYTVFKNGAIVMGVIKSLPSTFSSESFMHFDMNGKVYGKKVYGTFSRDHKIGDTVLIKYLDGYEHNFLFPDEENPLYIGIILSVALISAGIYSANYLIKLYKNKR